MSKEEPEIDIPSISRPKGIGDALNDAAGEIEAALPAGYDVSHFVRAAITYWKVTTPLHTTTTASYVRCIIQAAQMGLEPGPLDLVYIVPRNLKVPGTDRKEYQATLQISYKGWLDLMRRHPSVVDVQAHMVHADDTFSYAYGSDAHLRHHPAIEADRGPQVGAYGYVRLDNGAEIYEYWPIEKIRAHRDKHAANSTFWANYFEQMARKTLLLAIRSWVPRSAVLEVAVAIDEATEAVALPEAPTAEIPDGEPFALE